MGIGTKIFREIVKKFYRTYISYLNQWGEPLKEIERFEYKLVDAISLWFTVEKSLIKVTKIKNALNVNNNEIFNEFTFVKKLCKRWTHKNRETIIIKFQ